MHKIKTPFIQYVSNHQFNQSPQYAELHSSKAPANTLLSLSCAISKPWCNWQNIRQLVAIFGLEVNGRLCNGRACFRDEALIVSS